MANHLALFVHLVWSTDQRRPLLDARLQADAHRVIIAKCRALRCPPIAVGGMPDHMHVLVDLHPTVAVSNLAKEMKGASSHALTHLHGADRSFRWQVGYGAYPIRHSDVPTVRAYILRQAEHHARSTLVPRLEHLPPAPSGPPAIR